MKSKKNYSKYKYVKPLVFTIIIISAIAIILQPQVRQNITPSRLETFINNYGTLSVIIFLIIYTLRPIFLVLPVNIFAIAGGSAFGVVLGTIYCLIGNFLSATLAFYAARYLFRDFIEVLLKKRIDCLNGNLRKNGMKIIALARIMVPFDVLSYASGVSKLRYSDFIAGTMITSIFEIVMYTLIGENLKLILTEGCGNKRVILATICVLILGLALIIYKKRKFSNE